MPVRRLVREADGYWYFYGTRVVFSRDELTYGAYRPDAETTGLLSDSASLVTVSGNQTFSVNDTTVTGRRFTGKVSVTGKRITFVDCWFNGPGTDNLLQCTNANVADLVVRDCLFSPSTDATHVGSAIFGKRFTLERCDLSGMVDLVSVVGSPSASEVLDVFLLGNRFHGQLYEVPAPTWSDNMTHNDTIQIHYGGSRVEVIGNDFSGLADSPQSTLGAPVYDGQGVIQSGNRMHPEPPHALSWVMLSPMSTTAGLSGFKFNENWAGAGVVGINGGDWTTATGMQIIGNRWGADTWLPAFPDGDGFILMPSGQAATISGNVRYGNADYSGTPVPFNVRKNG